jgi:hypothetical protein
MRQSRPALPLLSRTTNAATAWRRCCLTIREQQPSSGFPAIRARSRAAARFGHVPARRQFRASRRLEIGAGRAGSVCIGPKRAEDRQQALALRAGALADRQECQGSANAGRPRGRLCVARRASARSSTRSQPEAVNEARMTASGVEELRPALRAVVGGRGEARCYPCCPQGAARPRRARDCSVTDGAVCRGGRRALATRPSHQRPLVGSRRAPQADRDHRCRLPRKGIVSTPRPSRVSRLVLFALIAALGSRGPDPLVSDARLATEQQCAVSRATVGIHQRRVTAWV